MMIARATNGARSAACPALARTPPPARTTPARGRGPRPSRPPARKVRLPGRPQRRPIYGKSRSFAPAALRLTGAPPSLSSGGFFILSSPSQGAPRLSPAYPKVHGKRDQHTNGPSAKSSSADARLQDGVPVGLIEPAVGALDYLHRRWLSAPGRVDDGAHRHTPLNPCQSEQVGVLERWPRHDYGPVLKVCAAAQGPAAGVERRHQSVYHGEAVAIARLPNARGVANHTVLGIEYERDGRARERAREHLRVVLV